MKLVALFAAIVAVAGASSCTPQAPANTAMTPATHTPFPIETGPHAVDCDVCHGAYASFSEFTCLTCHAHEQPAMDVQHQHLDAYAYESHACYSCHSNGTVMMPQTLVFDPARTIVVDGGIPSYAATSIARVLQTSQTLPLPMNHQATAIDLAAFAQCSNCHLESSSGSYFPGLLHSSLANLDMAAPTACSECHSITAPKGFVGPLAVSPQRSPPSAEMKHDAVQWVNGLPTATALVPDCAYCHVSPTQNAEATWSTNINGGPLASYHGSLAVTAQPQPTSCLDCHANSRPTATTGGTVFTSTNPAKPWQFDHAAPVAMGDCATCHAAGASPSWVGGLVHPSGSATPSTCLPCHEARRPTAQVWVNPPFDYGTNASGIKHGNGQDCALCHGGPGTGAWGGSQNFLGGSFTHANSPIAASTCIACHMSERPDLPPTNASPATLGGFDHSVNGTGDCKGCHQATVARGTYASFQVPGGDWRGGATYPGSVLIGGIDKFVMVLERKLVRTPPANLVTSMTQAVRTHYNAMLHTSTQVPAAIAPRYPGFVAPADNCWRCHTSTAGGIVTSYSGGLFHPALTDAGIPQTALTGCLDCHAQMRPVDVVEPDAGTNAILRPMDHAAMFTGTFTVGGAAANGVGTVDCDTCHQTLVGSKWGDGLFHSRIGAAVPADCVTCHYPLMATPSRSDLTNGTQYAMKHASTQLTLQSCQTCHTGALAQAGNVASTAWSGGQLHPRVATQPTACLECHSISDPAPNASTRSNVSYTLTEGASATNQGQWMNHGAAYASSADCALCHAADAKTSGSAWSKSTSFHAKFSAATTCRECHGLTNGGGSAPGTNNNMPATIVTSSTLTTASANATTGVPAGTKDQIAHTDVNVTGHDCAFCHTQQGVSTTAGIQGLEWAQATFHRKFNAANPLVINGTTGRCSSCHMNVRPGASFNGPSHTGFTATPGTTDCSSCHSWPGTGSATAPNWKGAGGGVPTSITVGGFTIPAPPAGSATTQAGITNLPHPATGGLACTTCHTSAGGGKQAIGYDHASGLINRNCKACHEAGSNLVGTVWNGATTQAAGAGDTRPFTLTALANDKNAIAAGHFYPTDCYECHFAPTGVALVTTGTTYRTRWNFPHSQSSGNQTYRARMTNPATCNKCHR